jgi:hypothetical protein
LWLLLWLRWLACCCGFAGSPAVVASLTRMLLWLWCYLV